MNNRLIKSNDAGGGGGCTNTVDLYNPFPDGGGVALYQLNGDATDVSGNYDGAASNVTYGAGEFGQAGVFNGSNSQILVSSVSGFPSGNSARTISFWMNSSSYLDGGVLGYGAGANNQGFLFYVAGGNLIVTFYINDASVNYSLSTNQWYNIVATHDGSTFTVYVNGSSVYSAARTLNTSATNFKIGGAPWNSSGEYFSGSIDQVRIFNRALRPYEIEALYTEEYCTPTIVPSEHFNTVLYTGNGSTQSITGVGFQPDFLWIKSRNATYNNLLQDSVRGAGSSLYSNLTYSGDDSGDYYVSSFDSNGFTMNVLGGSSQNNTGTNYVAWNFKAGGAAVTNTDGTITSQVSANTEAGFSIVSLTIPNDNTQSVGHGLDTAPSVIIMKARNAAEGWLTYHSSVGLNKYLILNSTAASANYTGIWSDVNSSTFTTLYHSAVGSPTRDVVAYCFAEVEGFSSFGSYVGTGASGNTVVTGFEPAFVMLKSTSATGNWRMWDNKRTLQNPRNNVLIANGSNAEFTNDVAIEFLENGFSFLGSGSNDSGASFIYMAFAADPTTVEPTLEDSFNTVTWTGNQSTQSITGVGFQPDFTWIKGRDSAWYHLLYDSVRGANKELHSNTTDSEGSDVNILQSFDNDGFTLGSSGEGNWNGQGYVAWCWKGAELPAINSNGSIPSVVSANPAAGFSIVSYTNSTSGYC